MITGLHHVGLGVADAKDAASFYKAVAGFQVVSHYQLETKSLLRPALAIDDQEIEVVLMAGPNGYIECIAAKGSQTGADELRPAVNGPGIRHFCLQNKNCTMLADAVKDGGGSLIADPLDLGTGNQYAYARDPEANIMEIEGLPFAPAAQPTWMGHVAIVTSNMDQLIEFYGGIIGSELQGRAMVGPGPQSDTMSGLKNARLEGAWLPAGNMLLEFWQFHSPVSPPRTANATILDRGYTHICLETDDLDDDMAQMLGAGATAICDPVETPSVRVQFAHDPEGNIVELLEPRAGFAQTIAALQDTGICSRTDALK